MRGERCMVHLFSRRYGPCRNTDIAVYIYKDGQRIPICREHWVKIAESDEEW